MDEAKLEAMPEPPALDTEGRIKTTGDVAAGDKILFYEAVGPSALKRGRPTIPVPPGYRVVAAEVVRESRGPDKDLRTLTLRVLESSGRDPIKPGTVIWRKGQSIYCNGCWRLPRQD
jgi:hypothetical protein